MTDKDRASIRILGGLRAEDGKSTVRIEDRLDTGIDDAWSALTDPTRLARWLGEFEGDLRPGGEYRARIFASGWEGTGRVEVCEPPRRLVVVNRGSDDQDEHVTEITLTANGQQTDLVFEQRGMPVNLLAAYGGGNQIHIEDLAAHLAGHERVDAKARWAELQPAYEKLAADIG